MVFPGIAGLKSSPWMVPLRHPTKSEGSRIKIATPDPCREYRCGESCALALRSTNAVSDRATTSVMASLNLAIRKRWWRRIVQFPAYSYAQAISQVLRRCDHQMKRRVARSRPDLSPARDFAFNCSLFTVHCLKRRGRLSCETDFSKILE